MDKYKSTTFIDDDDPLNVLKKNFLGWNYEKYLNEGAVLINFDEIELSELHKIPLLDKYLKFYEYRLIDEKYYDGPLPRIHPGFVHIEKDKVLPKYDDTTVMDSLDMLLKDRFSKPENGNLVTRKILLNFYGDKGPKDDIYSGREHMIAPKTTKAKAGAGTKLEDFFLPDHKDSIIISDAKKNLIGKNYILYKLYGKPLIDPFKITDEEAISKASMRPIYLMEYNNRINDDLSQCGNLEEWFKFCDNFINIGSAKRIALGKNYLYHELKGESLINPEMISIKEIHHIGLKPYHQAYLKRIRKEFTDKLKDKSLICGSFETWYNVYENFINIPSAIKFAIGKNYIEFKYEGAALINPHEINIDYAKTIPPLFMYERGYTLRLRDEFFELSKADF